MVLNTIRFLCSSLIANTVIILINFQPKFALERRFQHIATKFLNQKRFLAHVKSFLKSSISWRKKYDAFILELISRNRSK